LDDVDQEWASEGFGIGSRSNQEIPATGNSAARFMIQPSVFDQGSSPDDRRSKLQTLLKIQDWL